MDLKALLLVGNPQCSSDSASSDGVAGVPFAYLDVLGATVLERIVQRMRAAGISQISVLSCLGGEPRDWEDRAAFSARVDALRTECENFWNTAEEIFEQFRRDGADLVLVKRIGAYVELDYEDVIQHHIDKHCRMTSGYQSGG
jgi:hypothetical protein